MIRNGRAGSSPAPSTLKPLITQGFSCFLSSLKTMEIEVILTEGPREGPRNFKVIVKERLYSDPKLFIPKENGKPVIAPGRPWYVYFYWRSEGKQLDKKFRYKKGINKQKTVKARKELGKALVKAYQEALDRDWNPETKSVPKKQSSRSDFMSLEKAMHYAFQIKKTAKKSAPTLNGYEFHMNRFLDWCKSQGYLGMDIKEFTVDQFYEFHDWLRFEYLMEPTKKGAKGKKAEGEPLSGTSVNNHKRSLSALFTTLKNERFIPVNFIRDIPMVDEDPVNNKAFTIEELNRIHEDLKTSDPYLIHFISFILYPLLRPREICRLKVRDLNTEKGFLSVETKTEALSFRRIISKMKPTIDAMELHKYPGDYELFSNLDKPKDWSDTSLTSRVDHFGKRFRTVKTRLGFGREYGLYSCRHTAIMDLYNSKVAEGLGEQEIIFQLMPLTTHKSVAGIKKYLRRHQQSIPADHSHIYTIDF